MSWKGDSGRVRREGEIAGRGWRLRIMLDGSMKVTKCQYSVYVYCVVIRMGRAGSKGGFARR